MNDEIARTTAKYLSSKSREGVIVAAYCENKYDRLTIHVYDNPELSHIDKLRRDMRSKGAIVCHRGEELSFTDVTFWDKRNGGAA